MSGVVILGAGIVGLTTALETRKSFPNTKLTVVADKFTCDTTSNGAAGIFRPSTSFSGPNPQDTKQWIVDSYNYYLNLVKEPDSGISEISGFIFSTNDPSIVRNYYLEGLVKEYRAATPEELKLCPGDWKYGSYFTTLLIQCSQFLPWATHRLKSDGVEFVEKEVESLDEFRNKCDVLINCSGLGARKLASDHQLVPIRGQIYKMKAEWLDKFYYGDFDTYIIPTGGGSCTVGGSRHYDSYSTVPCKHDGAAILERAYSMLPRLQQSEILYTWVGLRPHRHHVRLDFENRNGLKVIHNYGHGGYGVTTAPGTAMNAVKLLRSALRVKSHL